MSDTLSSAFADKKPHYNKLDVLRVVEALTDVCFRENHGCHMYCSCCWYLQKQL